MTSNLYYRNPLKTVQWFQDAFIGTILFEVSFGTDNQSYQFSKFDWFKYLVGDGRFLLGGALLSVVYGMVMPVFSLLLGKIMNYYFEISEDTRLSDGNYQKVILIPFFLLGVVAWLLNFGQNSMWYRLGMKQTYLVRKKAIYILIEMPTQSKNQALSVLREKHLVEEDSPAFRIMEDFGNVFYYISEMVFSVIVAFIGSWQLSLLLIGCGPLLIATSVFEIKMLERSLAKIPIQIEVEKQERHIVDSLALIHECNTELEEYERYCQSLDKFFNADLKRRRLYIVSASVSVLLVTEMYVLGVWFSSWLAANHMISKGNVFMVLFAIGLAAIALMRIISLLKSVRQSRFEVSEFFRKFQCDRTECSWFKNHILQISKRRVLGELELCYLKSPALSRDGNWQHTKGISLQVRRGEIVVLVSRYSPEGNKVLEMIQRNIPNQCGKITIDGVDITQVNGYSFRSLVGNTCNTNIIFEGTVAENLQYGCPDVMFGDIVMAAKETYLHSFIRSLPRGYQTILGTPTSPSLPEWAIQRLALCRILLRKPLILLLDDKTVEAYDKYDDVPVDALKEICKERTCLLASRRVTVLQASTRVCVIKDGTIIADGKHSQLFEDCLYYRDIVLEEEEEEEQTRKLQNSRIHHDEYSPFYLSRAAGSFPNPLNRRCSSSSSGLVELDEAMF
eukprot:jgi/Galph1/4893/GphlegSOOS_G3502.1